MRLEFIEVAVAVKQAVFAGEVVRCADDAGGAVHGHASVLQFFEVLCGRRGNLFGAQRHLFSLPSRRLASLKLRSSWRPRRTSKKQNAQEQTFRAEGPVEPLHLRRRLVAEEVDPDIRVDQEHLSRRMASRSPTPSCLPPNLRNSVSCLSLHEVRKPCSTASRSVLMPVVSGVSAINWSSITMLVRTGSVG